jgi:large subunit ribosomal protein L4
MPKKKYRAALQSALSSKVSEGQLFVVSSISLEEPKTKVLAKALAQFAAGTRILLIAGIGQDGLTKAARNLAKVTVVTPDRLNVYDIVRAGTIVIPEGDLTRVKEVWA